MAMSARYQFQGISRYIHGFKTADIFCHTIPAPCLNTRKCRKLQRKVTPFHIGHAKRNLHPPSAAMFSQHKSRAVTCCRAILARCVLVEPGPSFVLRCVTTAHCIQYEEISKIITK